MSVAFVKTAIPTLEDHYMIVITFDLPTTTPLEDLYLTNKELIEILKEVHRDMPKDSYVSLLELLGSMLPDKESLDAYYAHLYGKGMASSAKESGQEDV